MRRVTAALGLALVLAVTVRADDGPVTIKLKKSGPGETSRETLTEKEANKVTVTVMGMEQAMNEAKTAKYVFTEEVIERPDATQKPTKLKRTYETAEMTKNDEKADLGLAGKTVLIEKKGDQFTFTIDGKELTGPAAEVLGQEFSSKPRPSEDFFLPKTPVKAGDGWKVDLKEVTKGLAGGGMEIDAAKSTATGKLTRVYEKNGHKYGVIEVKLDLTVTKVGAGGMEITLKDGSKMGLVVLLDGCIDGTEAGGSAKMTMNGELSGEVNGVSLKMTLSGQREGSSVAVAKK
jgi:hypothetical protein